MATIDRYVTTSGATLYCVRYRKPDNKQTMKRGFPTKRAAEAYANTVEVSKLKGEYVAPSDARVTVGELGPGWLNRQRGHLKPSADAVRDHQLARNPAAGTKLPRKTRKRPVYLTHGQVASLAAAAGEYEGLVLLLTYTGLRWGEATGLRVRDLDMLRKRATVSENAVQVGSKIFVGTTKSHQQRTVPLPEFLIPYLARQCEGRGRDDLLFPGDGGEHLQRPHTGSGWFDKAVIEAKVPRTTPHDLRHTAASLAVSAGANVKAVQKMLGHASAAMTLDIYADLFDDDLEAVATALNDARSRESVFKMCSPGSDKPQ